MKSTEKTMTEMKTRKARVRVVMSNTIRQSSGWPQIEDLPRTETVRFGDIIHRCWVRSYSSMDQVSSDLAN